MPATVGSGRILIIASYNGSRHYSSGITPAQMLRIQAAQLSKLRNNLDRVLVVVNEAPEDPDYDKALMSFMNAIRVPHGSSYEAWRDGFLHRPDHEWYFFLEDDYTFFLDDFDQRMIDMWTPETVYLSSRFENNHAAISNGLIRGETLRQIDWSKSDLHGQYTYAQRNWSSLFDMAGHKDVRGTYASPFHAEDGALHFRSDTKPILIGPVQLL